jgi:AraC-like DNA-binding protein
MVRGTVMGVGSDRGSEGLGHRRVWAGRAAGENGVLLRWQELPGVELLRADFRRHAFVPHWHDAYMFATSAHGAERVRHLGREQVVGPETLMMLNPGELHDGEAEDPETGWHFRVLYCSAESVAEVVRERGLRMPGELRFERAMLEDAQAADAFLAMHAGLEGAESRLERDTHFVVGLARLLEFAAVAGERRVEAGVSREAVERAREYLHAAWWRPVSLDGLAEVAGLSRYHLLRTFRAQFGLPPHAYQMQLRVLRAKELLFGGMAAKDAALEAGFYDQAHLTNALRRYTGVTPGRVREHRLVEA